MPLIAVLLIALFLMFPARAGPRLPAQTRTREVLTLKTALMRAIENNRTFRIASITMRSAELDSKDAWDRMFLPQVDLSASTTSSYTVGQLTNEQGRAQSRATYEQGYPTASGVTLSVGKYTLFNGWKDWIAYEQSLLNYSNAQIIYAAAERELKTGVVEKMFRLKIAQDKLDTAQRSVDIAEAVHQLVNSRIKVGQASESDVASSSVDLIQAKNDRDQKVSDYRTALLDLNQLLGDPLETHYQIEGKIRYRPLGLTAERAYEIFLQMSPTIKQAKTSVKNAEYSVDLAEKNRLPLPKIDFSGVSLAYSNSYYATANAGIQSDSNPNWNVSGSISLTVPIFGSGGLIGGRTVEKARLSRDQAEISYTEAIVSGRAAVANLIGNIQQQELAVANNRQQYEQSSKLLDSLFSKLSSGSINRLELRDAIRQARDSQLALLEAELTHLAAKLSLAKQIGLDALPGDQYE